MSGSANVQVESANGRLAEISKCLSQQMSKSSKQKSRQQISVSKSPVGKWKIGVSSQVFLYIRLRTQLKDTSPSSRLIYFELFCNQLVLFPTARTTKRRNLMLVVGNKISVLGGYILPVKSCGFFQGILKAKVL